jgi:tRNA pseudouridine38-40 synthase
MRAFRVAYDGRHFYGFQRQPDVPTVEDAILEALDALDVTTGVRTLPPGYAAAGRTDAGVSALAQTVAFRAPDWLTPHALNGQLPDEVWSWASADATAEFHARHDAQAREYTYYLDAEGLDAERARAALEALAGEHDFHNLTTDDEHTRRSLETALTVDAGFLELHFTADGFPRNFVRRAAELVREVASGESALDRVERVLAAAPLDGAAGVPPAPPYSLVLSAVAYDLAFTVDPAGAASTRAFFGGRRREAAARARVAEFIEDRV